MRLALALALLAAPALAQQGGADPAPQGETNPEELTLQSAIEKARRGEVDMVVCASGYFITKWGHHAEAREVFEACAEAGYAAAMTWMSQMEDNGLGGPEDPEAAAEWSRRAAATGDPVGELNYGLALLRGRGVEQDEAAGRAMVDRAAAQGLDDAVRLKGAGYDPAEVTPDADEPRYAPKLF
ncbi:sel1 repeat family protein [Albimonas sp. CAU 1670]|uniref:tetratricopeptide repeat protein n=1 Tax=Albimonas sp. CAU 1670 TaxID=3032599 RepID=UPI0023D9CEF0|nr:sel1 repeat family protein [Albimonas sp. CAU 1670]MDF2235616.1 sel1 repeat family protein [Albimonas sp. CAU 1670]